MITSEDYPRMNISVSVDVCDAFVLEGPCRSWVCAVEGDGERDHFLSVLRSAIDAALTGYLLE